MTPDELRAIMVYLRERVHLGTRAADSPIIVSFRGPTEKEMIGAGLPADGARRILGAPWWDEMVEDIEETPDMCDPDDSPEQVLEYARDVVSEYIRKRFPLNEE
jgi:hypothetical protein